MNTLLNAAAAAIVFFSGVPVAKAETPAARMALVQVQVTGDGVSLSSVKVVDGSLKRPRVVVAHQGELRFDVVDAAGNITFSGTFADPTRVELEYFNEDGTIGRIVEEKESGTAYLRIPYDPETLEIRLSRMVESGEGTAGVLKAKSLGQVLIQLDQEVADE